MDWATDTLADWSVRAYPLVLQAYPSAFRREFGESMAQVFRDLVRRERRERGLVGLGALWMRMVVDALVGAVNVYASERSGAMFRLVLTMSLLYVGTLALATGYGAVRFGEFYEPPAFSRSGAPQTAQEDTLIAAYEQALGGEFGRYKAFTFRTGIVLAVWLGVASALFGRWQGSVWHGAGAFLAGAVLTVAAFEVLPSIWFPFDRYAVGFVWLLTGFPVAAAVWVLATVLGRFNPGQTGFHAT